MNVNLLYPDREWAGTEKYFDNKSIVADLGLKTLFSMASKDVLVEDGVVRKVLEGDEFISDVMSKVMMVPLKNEEEIYFRQDIVKDALENPDFFFGMYRIATELSNEWNRLGKVDANNAKMSEVSWIVTRIHVIRLFVETLSRIKRFFAEYEGTFKSDGISDFVKNFLNDFNRETEQKYRKFLDSVDFYVSDRAMIAGENMVSKPKIVLEWGIGGGLKLARPQISSIETTYQKYRNPNSTLTKIREMMDNTHAPSDAITIAGDITYEKQMNDLIFSTMKYAINFMTPFYDECTAFFYQLRIQMAFYCGAIYLKKHVDRFHLPICMPRVCRQQDMSYADLKEFVMCIEQRVTAVGNTCDISDKMLLVITGANQGGKSTFLRSVGIAQVMLQCGLFVTAQKFESGLFPSLFTHFTRREDSAMNSGRLDEELGRMSQIVDNLDGNSLLLLNESFATTTEIEGSNIAYDIIRAIHEAGVKIVTVTHLLSFAQRLYGETEALSGGQTLTEEDTAVEKKDSDFGWNHGVVFFCAERLPDGHRTYRMKQSVPELTSFGLDLYKEIIGTDIE